MRVHLLAACLLCLSPALAQDEPVLGDDDVRLFDGRTLTGWVTTGGRYDGHAEWCVEDGALTGRQGPGGAGGLLYTERPYRDFILSVDVRIEHPFDSGLFLRMVPPPGGKGAQVTIDHRPGGEIAGIYADGFLQHNETAREGFDGDVWHRFTVRCVGADMHLTVWLDGVLVTDYRTPASTPGFAPTGLIGLQVHGGGAGGEGCAVRFRRILLRQLPEFDPTLFSCDDRGLLTVTDAGSAAGWRPLFNGRDLSGWDPGGHPESYLARDGVLVFPKAGVDGFIATAEDHRDFELRLDFRTAFMANSGVFLRAARKGGNPAFSGCELQILDDFNWERVTGSKLEPWQFTGSLYGSVPAPRGALLPLGHWNEFAVRFRGSHLAVELNDRLLYAVDTDTVPLESSQARPFKERAETGFIGLQRHAPDAVEQDAYAWFRNIFLRPLAK